MTFVILILSVIAQNSKEIWQKTIYKQEELGG